MTATLQEAIAAVRNGDTERAQLLAAEVIQDNPDDAHAWYLLSQLVESDGRRAAYLSKVLALDPTHERARAEFDALPVEASAVLPVPALAVPVAAAEELVEVAVVEAGPLATAEPEHVPDWLHPLTPEPTPEVAPVYEVEPVAVAAPPAPPAARPVQPPAVTAPRPAPRATTPPPPPPQPRGNGALTVLLMLLGLLTLAVLAILAYLLLF